MSENRTSSLKETIRTLVYAVAIALFVRTFAYEPFNIPSGSMKPTLLVGDYLFVSKFSYGYSHYSLPFSLPLFEGRIFASMPERGDVAVFKLPSDNRTDYIKRIVGLPGDKMQMINGILHINDEPVEVRRLGTFRDDEKGRIVEEPLYEETLPNGRKHPILDLTSLGALDNTRVYQVPEGHVFAMGDNRDNSLDSRVDHVSYIPLVNLIGRADFLLFSVNGSARLWEPWKWPWAIRFHRMFQPIN
ncbi:MAG: signal peptidase I [Geminicoccaceae bacterium]|nr:signal peptidase I [Geminicoccaceae bacterium]